jgi:hypothetical protein
MLPRAWKLLQTFWVSVTVPTVMPVKLPLMPLFSATCPIQIKISTSTSLIKGF